MTIKPISLSQNGTIRSGSTADLLTPLENLQTGHQLYAPKFKALILDGAVIVNILLTIDASRNMATKYSKNMSKINPTINLSSIRDIVWDSHETKT